MTQQGRNITGEFNSKQNKELKSLESIYLLTTSVHLIQSKECIHSRYASTSANDLSNEDHKIRTGIEPIFSDNRSAVLPLNYLIFSQVF